MLDGMMGLFPKNYLPGILGSHYDPEKDNLEELIDVVKKPDLADVRVEALLESGALDFVADYATRRRMGGLFNEVYDKLFDRVMRGEVEYRP